MKMAKIGYYLTVYYGNKKEIEEEAKKLGCKVGRLEYDNKNQLVLLMEEGLTKEEDKKKIDTLLLGHLLKQVNNEELPEDELDKLSEEFIQNINLIEKSIF